MKAQLFLRCAPLALGIVFAPIAQAGLIGVNPATGVTTSSELPGGDRINDHMVDGSGLVGNQHDSFPNGTMWLSIGTGFGGIDSDPWVLFDLGAVYEIDSFHVWNYNESGGGGGGFKSRGVNSVSVEYGTTIALGSVVPGITNFAIATGLNSYTGEAFDSFAPFNARYIKFDINSNYGDTNSFYGLSEVQFTGEVPVPVPEPNATWVTMVLLSGILLGNRHRRCRQDG